MEIVIENDPYRPSSASPGPTYLRSPLGSQPPLVSSGSAFYYATLPRGGSGSRMSAAIQDALDGAPTGTSVRRVDKSGLLEIAEPEPIGRQSCPRHLVSAEGHGSTLTRRVERSGLLESVPELSDQCHRPGLASEELLAAAATARSMVERQQHLLGAETDDVDALLRRVSFAAEAQELSATGHRETEVTPRSGPRVKFAADEVLVQEQRIGPTNISNIPDVIEAHGATSTSSASLAAVVKPSKGAPEGERAEAEGCEHTAIESLEEGRVSYKGATHAADGVQAVHVIILSEQL